MPSPRAIPLSRQVLGRMNRRLLVRIGLGVILAVCILFGVMVTLANADPSGWTSVDPHDPKNIASAQSLETAIVNQLHASRPAAAQQQQPGSTWTSAAWTVSLKESDANVWFAASLPRWLAEQDPPILLPADVTEFQTRFTGDGVRLAARVSTGVGSHAISAEIRPEVRADGSLWIRMNSLALGRLPLPASWLVEEFTAKARSGRSSGAAPAESDQLLRTLRGETPAVQNAVIRLADGRRVRLLRVEPKEGELWLTMQTLGANR